MDAIGLTIGTLQISWQRKSFPMALFDRIKDTLTAAYGIFQKIVMFHGTKS